MCNLCLEVKRERISDVSSKNLEALLARSCRSIRAKTSPLAESVVWREGTPRNCDTTSRRIRRPEREAPTSFHESWRIPKDKVPSRIPISPVPLKIRLQTLLTVAEVPRKATASHSFFHHFHKKRHSNRECVPAQNGCELKGFHDLIYSRASTQGCSGVGPNAWLKKMRT